MLRPLSLVLSFFVFRDFALLFTESYRTYFCRFRDFVASKHISQGKLSYDCCFNVLHVFCEQIILPPRCRYYGYSGQEIIIPCAGEHPTPHVFDQRALVYDVNRDYQSYLYENCILKCQCRVLFSDLLCSVIAISTDMLRVPPGYFSQGRQSGEKINAGRPKNSELRAKIPGKYGQKNLNLRF